MPIFSDIKQSRRYQVRWPSSESGRYITAYWTADDIQKTISGTGDPGIETLALTSDGVNVTEKWIRITYLSNL